MKRLMISVVTTMAMLVASQTQAGWFDWFKKPNISAQTQHPIVLIPGIFAFDTIAGVDHFYKIPAALSAQGAEVHTARINAFDSSARRGARLIEQLLHIRVTTQRPHLKFNLMGHSQGGITARYVMNARPDLVASVTTMHTPHLGSPLADIVTGIAPEGSLQGIGFATFANAVGDLLNLLSSNRVDDANVYFMLAEFNKAGAAKFSQDFPAGMPSSYCGQGPDSVTIAGHTIRLYSWSGTSKVTTAIDLSDALFAITGIPFPEASDGVTGRCSSHFGRVLKDDYNMNHLDISNQLLGMVSLFETKPETLFQNHANRLKNEGL